VNQSPKSPLRIVTRTEQPRPTPALTVTQNPGLTITRVVRPRPTPVPRPTA
jgi:hypothetical protein